MDAKQREFILLRDAGQSYDAIAKKLKVSKATLIQWRVLLRNEFEALQMEAFIKIKEVYGFNQKKKYEMMLKQLDKLDTAILESDLTTTALKDLYMIKNSILIQITNLEHKISVDANVTQTDDFGTNRLRLSLDEVE